MVINLWSLRWFCRVSVLTLSHILYIPRNMQTVFALLCFVVVIHWLIFPYPSGLLHWHCGNLTIAPVPAKQPWWIWINTSCEFIMNDCITTTKQSTTKPCAYFLGYTVSSVSRGSQHMHLDSGKYNIENRALSWCQYFRHRKHYMLQLLQPPAPQLRRSWHHDNSRVSVAGY